MRADVFVHPSWHSENFKVPEGVCYGSYVEAMQHSYDASDLPILAYSPQNGPYPPLYDWSSLFDEELKFPTRQRSGELADPSDAKKIIDALQSHQITQVYIHGCYLEACVDTFIVETEGAIKPSSVCYGPDFEPAIWLLPEMNYVVASLGNVVSMLAITEKRIIKPSNDMRDIPRLNNRLLGYVDADTTIYNFM